MDEQRTRYILLRQGSSWGEGATWKSLRLTADGALTLMRKAGPGTTSGALIVERLDAGEGGAWSRVRVDADIPAGASARLEFFSADTRDATPTWVELPALDGLLPEPRRYLWLRVGLRSDERVTSLTRLLQVSAETTGASYLDMLPALYRREDEGRGFLHRWLELLRAELGDLELAIDDLPRQFDLAAASEDALSRLAGWLAFDPPRSLNADALHELLPHIYELYQRRGTCAGLRAFIKLYTGARPYIFETYRARRLWVLDESAALGFSSGLAPALPDGMVVPGPTLPDPALQGLKIEQYTDIGMTQRLQSSEDRARGWYAEYFEDSAFTKLRLAREEPGINIGNLNAVPVPELRNKAFSARWTCYADIEDHSLNGYRLQYRGATNIWVDDEQVIDMPTIIPRRSWPKICVEYISPEKDAYCVWTWSRTPPLYIRRHMCHALRWSGQVQPRYSEVYTFAVVSDGLHRLWIGSELVIDCWEARPTAESRGIVVLTGGQWHPIRLEVKSDNDSTPTAQLYWSSRSQVHQIIPAERLYAVVDDNVKLGVPANKPLPESLLVVGESVVGESGPLVESDIGAPLFDDAAHHFSVLVPSWELSSQEQRAEVRRIIEAEKPAHTDYWLGFIEPCMRVGFQAMVGIDSIVAGGAETSMAQDEDR